MEQKWPLRFSENIKDYAGYPIGKTLSLLKDPEIISLAGGLPSPHMFLTDDFQAVSKRILAESSEKIMQYSAIPGESSLINAIREFLKRDAIDVRAENILVTTSGQHGLDLLGRLFLNPRDAVLMDRPTFAGAIVAFQMQRPRFVGENIESDGSNIAGFQQKLDELNKEGRPPKFIYVVPDFQNPSGITMSLEKRKRLLDLSYEYDVPVVEDSPYRDLRYFGETLPSTTK